MKIQTDLIKINLEELSQCGYDQLIESNDLSLYELAETFYKASEMIKENDEKGKYRALILLTLICSLTLDLNNVKKPFRPMRVKDLSFPDDFNNENGELLATFADLIHHPMLAARVYDLAWVISHNYSAAKKAVERYMKAFHDLRRDNWFESLDLIERALMIAKNIKDSEKIESIKLILIAIIDSKSEFFDLRAAYRVPKLLMEQKLVPYIEIGNLAEALSDLMPENFTGCDYRYNILKISQKGFQKAQDYENVEIIKLKAANVLLKKSKLAEKDSKALAAGCLQEAIYEFKMCTGQKEKITELQQKLKNLLLESLPEMSQISIPLNLEEFSQQTKLIMTGQNLKKSIQTFAFIISPLKRKKFEEKALENAQKDPIANTIPQFKYNEEMKPVIMIPPLLSSRGGDYELALKSACFDQAKFFRNITVNGIILPALQELLKTHTVDEKMLFESIGNCPFFPPGRERLWIKGFFYGFQEDFTISLSLLIPQFEHALRKYLESKGEQIWRIDSIGQYSEITLGEILESSTARDILGEDIQFELQDLLVDRAGENFRNEFAHGLMSESKFYSPASIYLWWLLFQVIMNFCK